MAELEASLALLDHARYGEIAEVKELLAQGVSPNVLNPSGNSALHYACANGEAEIVTLLCTHGAQFLANGTGNTPMHWAVQQKQRPCVEALLKALPTAEGMDVLLRNSFGKSALSDAFNTGDTEYVGLILSHPSAEEDMLLAMKKKDGDGDEEGSQSVTVRDRTITNGSSANASGLLASWLTGLFHYCTPVLSFVLPQHRLKFNGKVYMIRELEIPDAASPFGASCDDDRTGLAAWGASIILARWIADLAAARSFEGQRVLELGAGCGVAGLSLAVHGKASLVHLTDLHPATVANLKHNMKINAQEAGCFSDGCSVTAGTLDWGDEATWPGDQFDVIVGCDLAYQSSLSELLLKVVLGLLKPGGRLLYCAPDGRDGQEEWFSMLTASGLTCTCNQLAPTNYSDNPIEVMESPDEPDAASEVTLMPFIDLVGGSHKLWEYSRPL
ncbi:unnamed protein product [Chrysoparadoxa australica]